MKQSYQVKIDAFEGPLDLLLHLINQNEIDIYDIPVNEITEQYMDYIHTMQRLELNIASEYLVMSATLLALKSETLLPNQETEKAEEEYMDDPREELVQRLLEYRQYKYAAKNLQNKESEGKHLYTKPPEELYQTDTGQQVDDDTTIYDMIQAMKKMFKRKQWNAPLETKVKHDEVSINDRMKDVLHRVKGSSEVLTFDELFDYPTRPHIVATFIALLELMKDKSVTCHQDHPFGDLYVFYLGD